jgi:GNAT superfamily N-acetyltransferase
VTLEQVQISQATPGDARAIAELHTTVWREAYRGLVPDQYLDTTTLEDRRTRWALRLGSGDRQAVIARHGGTVIGAASWSECPEQPPGLELASLYIVRGHRGSGVAERLVHEAIGDRPAWLWVFAPNARARAFYRRVGFVKEGPDTVDPDTGVLEIRLERPGSVPPSLDG